MIFGIAGAHRSGKTTLAKAVAEELGIAYVSSSFGEAAKRFGYDSVADMSLTQRMAMQTKVLMEHQQFLIANNTPVITDRTPVDMMAYALAEFGMQSHAGVDPDLLVTTEAYKKLCLDMTSRYYDTIFVVGPLEHYAEEPGKPAFNAVFQSHIQLLIDGAVCNLDHARLAWIEVTDLQERKEILHDQIVERLNLLDAMKSTAPHIH